MTYSSSLLLNNNATGNSNSNNNDLANKSLVLSTYPTSPAIPNFSRSLNHLINSPINSLFGSPSMMSSPNLFSSTTTTTNFNDKNNTNDNTNILANTSIDSNFFVSGVQILVLNILILLVV